MRNILSYAPCTRFAGKEIKEWIKFHIENQTEYTKEAQRMTDYLNISDEVEYTIHRGNYQASERKFCVLKASETV